MIHVQVWTGGGNFRVTDMVNAGKRGKVCRVLRFSGVAFQEWATDDPIQIAAAKFTRQACYLAEDLDVTRPFEEAVDAVLLLIHDARSAGVPESYITFYEETIKGINAPRPKLTAGVEGAWSASADENGIHLHAIFEVNGWTEYTSGQTKARAYDIAKKVWGRVSAARTLREASDILSAAGAKLYGYCDMD